MVIITHLGTGSVEDFTRVNTAYLIEHNGKIIQVDAGYDVFNPLCEALGGLEALKSKPDMILLTHRHGDHIASLPREVLGMWRACNDTGTTRELYVTGEPGAVTSFEARNEMDYPGFMEKLYKDKIRFTVEPIDGKLDYAGFEITYAPTKHSVANYAYRFDTAEYSFAISGDGLLTPESRKLFEGVDLLIHEGFTVERSHPVHASVKEVLDYAIQAQIKNVSIVHMDLLERPERSKARKIAFYMSRGVDYGIALRMPDDGDRFSLINGFVKEL